MLEKFSRAQLLSMRLTLSYRLYVFHRRHPRAGATAALVALLGTGMTAFGVAPLTVTDPAPVVTQLITETVDTAPVAPQLDALEAHSLRLHRADSVRSGDTADSLLRRLGIDDIEAAKFLRADPLARSLFDGSRGRSIRALSTSSAAGLAALDELVMLSPAKGAQADSHFVRLRISRADGVLRATEETGRLGAERRIGSGLIESSLFAATDAARLPDSITTQLAEIFGSDIDFRRDLRRGDHFSVVYEIPTADGEPVPWEHSAGRIVAARFVNNGSAHEAMWYQEDGQAGAFMGLDGRNKTRSFLASPLAFSRVTSGFAMRFHPIQQTWKAHLGVDYAAPTGTPVRAVGGGSVEFSGWQNGYGNVVQIKHSGDRSTLYAHLSTVQVKLGEKLEQGATVGTVGSTGWATGPHLHFEFKVAGQQVDPVTVARASDTTELSAAARARFAVQADTVEQQLAAAQRMGTHVAKME